MSYNISENILWKKAYMLDRNTEHSGGQELASNKDVHSGISYIQGEQYSKYRKNNVTRE